MEQKKLNTTILIKRRVSGNLGPPTSLAPGELAFNEANATAYIGTTNISLTGSTSPDPGFF
jgi:hypothetical protein